MTKRAIVAGATGLVGEHLTRYLLDDDDFSDVLVVTRRPLEITHHGLHQVVTDFNDRALLEKEVRGDALFCCLGTTMKKAGTKAAFRWVDLELPLMLGQIARDNDVPAYMLLTALGANARSPIFYNRIKGMVEEAIIDLRFITTLIFRPSLLLGQRKEKRSFESVGQSVMKRMEGMMVGPLRKYRPIEAKVVAQAMLHFYKETGKGQYYVSSGQMNQWKELNDERE